MKKKAVIKNLLRIKATNFKLKKLENNSYQYFSYQGPDYQLCIEPNKNGYDVALYLLDGILFGSRVRVAPKLEDLPNDCFKRAVDTANDLVELHLSSSPGREAKARSHTRKSVVY